MKVKKSYINASKRLRSLDSLNEFLKVMLCDFGITYSPTVVTEQELGYYILDELRLHDIKNFKSVRTGVPHLLDLDYLNYVHSRLETSDSFYTGLNYILGYLQTTAEIEALYDFSASLNDSFEASRYSKNYSLRKIKKVDEFDRPLYTVRDIVSPFNSVQGSVVRVVPITDIYYRYFEQVTGFRGVEGWTFFEGMTRAEEYYMLHYVFEGHIAPTTPRVDEFWQGYLELVIRNGVQVYKELEMFIERSQNGVINSFISKTSDYELKYMNWFSVGLTDRYSIHKEYPVYLTNIAWDSVKSRPLPIVNQLEGIGGEFVYKPLSPQDRPFEVTYYDGRTVLMYKVSQYSKLNRNRLNLERYYRYLNRASHGEGSLRDGRLYKVNNENYAMIKQALSLLEREGIYGVD